MCCVTVIEGIAGDVSLGIDSVGFGIWFPRRIEGGERSILRAQIAVRVDVRIPIGAGNLSRIVDAADENGVGGLRIERPELALRRAQIAEQETQIGGEIAAGDGPFVLIELPSVCSPSTVKV
jgi:hypothetical protein